MKTKRLFLILASIAGVIILLWAATRWLLIPWLLSVLPPQSDQAAFIESLKSVTDIFYGAITAISTVVTLFISLTKKEKEEKAVEFPIKPLSLTELRERPGKQGGRVNWIDRGATKVGDLRAHGRIVITGQMKLGKTREAIELIQKAVMDEQVKEGRIFEPSPTFRFFNRKKLQEMLRSVDQKEPILLFLDDLPFHYYGESLERLSDLLHALRVCTDVLLIATARLDQMTDEHRIWLAKQRVYEISLSPMDKDHIGRLLDAATGIFELQVDDEARTTFIAESDGTPELTLLCLRRLQMSGETHINGRIAAQVASESLLEAWAAAKRYIQERHPATKVLFDSLATFHAAGVSKDTHFVLQYASHLWKTRKKRQKIRRVSAYKQSLSYLVNFDIVEQEGFITVPDVIVEGQIGEEFGLEKLGEFLLQHRRVYQLPFFRQLYPQARTHAWCLLDIAKTAFDKQEFALAILFSNAAISFFDHPIFYDNRGVTFYGMKDYPAALADYTRAIELRPDDAFAYNNRGRTYSKMGDYPAAMANFARAIELQPDDDSTFFNRGLTHDRMEDYLPALADYTRAIELQPDNANAHNNRGNIYTKMGDHPAALADFTRTIELQPDDANAHNNRGLTYAKMEDYPAALADYAKAIKLQPDDDSLVYSSACAYALQREVELSCTWLRRAIQMDLNYLEMARTDTDFDSIRDEPEFQTLLKEFDSW